VLTGHKRGPHNQSARTSLGPGRSRPANTVIAAAGFFRNGLHPVTTALTVRAYIVGRCDCSSQSPLQRRVRMRRKVQISVRLAETVNSSVPEFGRPAKPRGSSPGREVRQPSLAGRKLLLARGPRLVLSSDSPEMSVSQHDCPSRVAAGGEPGLRCTGDNGHHHHLPTAFRLQSTSGISSPTKPPSQRAIDKGVRRGPS